jgi:UDPglucose 6-dehydrogenase
MRESPALVLIEQLLEAGAKVTAHDPVAIEEGKRRLDDTIAYADTSYDALKDADALVIVTDWNEYRHPDFERIRTTLRRPIVIDGRNLYDPARMAKLGFTYFSIGRSRA